MVLYLETYFST